MNDSMRESLNYFGLLKKNLDISKIIISGPSAGAQIGTGWDAFAQGTANKENGICNWSFNSEEDSFEKMESGINAAAIDFACFGCLYRDKGFRNGI